MADAPSLSDAAAAMQVALDASENTDVAPDPTPPQATPESTETTPNVETPVEAPQVNQLDGIDLSAFDPNVVKKIQDGFLRQQDYTKKTQEIAPLRKFLEESGSDLDHLRNSVDFVNRLESDPAFLRDVAQELTDLAKGTVAPTEQPKLDPENTGIDPALYRDVNELREWKAQKEQEVINNEIIAHWENKIQTAENAVRESNPSYTDTDIGKIYELLPAHEHDFFAAQEQYEALRNFFVNSMVKPKLDHVSAADPVNSGSLAGSPKTTNTIEDAAAATRERMRQQA